MSKDKITTKADGTPKSPNNLIYVRDMLGELRAVADAEGADMLCYLIEMAYVEAGDILSNSRPANSGLNNK